MLRLPWLHTGTAPLPQWRSLVPGGEPVQEERAAGQGEDRRTAGAQQQGRLGRSASTVEPRSARLVGLLLLRRPRVGIRGRRSTCLQPDAALPPPTTQSAGAWGGPVHPRVCLRGIGRPMPATRAQSVVAVGLAVKPVGKPDAGNPHVRFDERGRETGRCHRARPRLYRSTVASVTPWSIPTAEA